MIVATAREDLPQRFVLGVMERPDPHGSTALVRRRCAANTHRVLSVISWVEITVPAGAVVDLSWICGGSVLRQCQGVATVAVGGTGAGPGSGSCHNRRSPSTKTLTSSPMSVMARSASVISPEPR